VEGAFIAAIQAAAGDSLADVAWAAGEAGTFAKDTDDGAPAPTAPTPDTQTAAPAGPKRVIEITVRNPMGLHGRPGADLVKTAAGFRSHVSIQNLTTGYGPANAKSSTKVLAAGVRKGQVIRIAAQGDDADQAVEAIRSLAEAGFGEGRDVAGLITEGASSDAPADAPAAGEGRDGAGVQPAPAQVPPIVQPAAETRPLVVDGLVAGRPGAAGIAIGPIWVYGQAAGGLATRPAAAGGETATAEAAIAQAAEEAGRQLHDLAERVRGLGRPDDAGILEAQAMMATDPELLDAALARATAGEPAASAVEAAAAEVAEVLAGLPDELLAARAADVRDVGARIARVLRGENATLPTAPSIAVADDLPPSIAAELPPGLLLGIALESGSVTAHAVILARGMGIPAIVGARGLVAAASAATTIAMDGATGEIALDPDATRLAGFEARATRLAERRRAAAALRDRPAATADGSRVVLLANIGGPADTARALEMRAEGVGLFRTEFLFMQRRTAPSEAEQVEPYRRVFEAFGPNRPVVVRLADIGGDKALPYLNLPPEANPFLGVRAIRLAGRNRELLSAQLRAIWRAAGKAGVTPHVMAPMVATIADVELLMDLRDEARAAVASSGDPLPERMITGVMIEIPAAAIQARELARRVDFFSIGTNDLTQYAMAADRSNPELAYLQDALHPAVLRLIAGVVAGAAEAGIPTAVCGELAGDPAGALVLAGLGIGELSADAGSLDGMRAALAGVTRTQLEDLGERALAAPDAAAVRSMAAKLLS
jgi:phosphocarrier protein FPr